MAWHHGRRWTSTSGDSQRGEIAPLCSSSLSLMLVMALAGLVTAFVAYPNRGEPIPHAAWLSEQMTKLRDRIEP